MSTVVSATAAQQQLRGFARVWRTLKQLFHEVIAAVFAVLAVGWLNAALRAWSRDAARWLVATAVAVAEILAFAIIFNFSVELPLGRPNPPTHLENARPGPKPDTQLHVE